MFSAPTLPHTERECSAYTARARDQKKVTVKSQQIDVRFYRRTIYVYRHLQAAETFRNYSAPVAGWMKLISIDEDCLLFRKDALFTRSHGQALPLFCVGVGRIKRGCSCGRINNTNRG